MSGSFGAVEEFWNENTPDDPAQAAADALREENEDETDQQQRYQEQLADDIEEGDVLGGTDTLLSGALDTQFDRQETAAGFNVQDIGQGGLRLATGEQSDEAAARELQRSVLSARDAAGKIPRELGEGTPLQDDGIVGQTATGIGSGAGFLGDAVVVEPAAIAFETATGVDPIGGASPGVLDTPGDEGEVTGDTDEDPEGGQIALEVVGGAAARAGGRALRRAGGGFLRRLGVRSADDTSAAADDTAESSGDVGGLNSAGEDTQTMSIADDLLPVAARQADEIVPLRASDDILDTSAASNPQRLAEMDYDEFLTGSSASAGVDNTAAQVTDTGIESTSPATRDILSALDEQQPQPALARSADETGSFGFDDVDDVFDDTFDRSTTDSDPLFVESEVEGAADDTFSESVDDVIDDPVDDMVNDPFDPTPPGDESEEFSSVFDGTTDDAVGGTSSASGSSSGGTFGNLFSSFGRSGDSGFFGGLFDDFGGASDDAADDTLDDFGTSVADDTSGAADDTTRATEGATSTADDTGNFLSDNLPSRSQLRTGALLGGTGVAGIAGYNLLTGGGDWADDTAGSGSVNGYQYEAVAELSQNGATGVIVAINLGGQGLLGFTVFVAPNQVLTIDGTGTRQAALSASTVLSGGSQSTSGSTSLEPVFNSQSAARNAFTNFAQTAGGGDGGAPSGQSAAFDGEMDFPREVGAGEGFNVTASIRTSSRTASSGTFVVAVATGEGFAELGRSQASIPATTSQTVTFDTETASSRLPEGDYTLVLAATGENGGRITTQNVSVVSDSPNPNQEEQWGDAEILRELGSGWYLVVQPSTAGDDARYLGVGQRNDGTRIYLQTGGQVSTSPSYFDSEAGVVQAFRQWQERAASGNVTSEEAPSTAVGRPSATDITRDTRQSGGAIGGTLSFLQQNPGVATAGALALVIFLYYASGGEPLAYLQKQFDDLTGIFD